MKRFLLLSVISLLISGLSGQDYRDKKNYKSWVKLAPKFDDAFLETPEARRIGDNVLLYQQTTGAWSKNIYMPAELTDNEKKKVIASKNKVNESTIDNNATTTEIEYLSRLYQATQDDRYKEAVIRGIEYLLEAQYDNGGWPQFYPRPKGYYIQITYNDNTMVRVMNQLRRIYEKQAPYSFIAEGICTKAKKHSTKEWIVF